MNLIEILRKKYNLLLASYNNQIKLQSNNEKQELENNLALINDMLNELNRDAENIYQLNVDTIKALFIKYNVKIVEDFDKKMDDIRFILKGKYDNSFPLELSKEQLEYIKSILSSLLIIRNKISEKLESLNHQSVNNLGDLEIEVIEYEDLIEKIQEPDYRVPILEGDYYLIERILNDDDFSFKNKRDLLLGVKAYNDSITILKKKKTSKLNIEEFIDLLTIDYELPSSYIKVVKSNREEIAKFGDWNNIVEILDYMVSEIPSDNKTNILKNFPPQSLIPILIYATKASVQRTYQELVEKNMLSKTFYETPAAWRYNVERKPLEKKKPVMGKEHARAGLTLRQESRETTFKDMILNYQFFQEKGFQFDLNDESMKPVLTISNWILKRNYSHYELYGFFKEDKKSKITPSMLVYSGIMDKIDLLIEAGLYNYVLKYPSAVQNMRESSFAILFDLKTHYSESEYVEKIHSKIRPECLTDTVGQRNPLVLASKEEIDEYLKNANLFIPNFPQEKEMKEYLERVNPTDIPLNIFTLPEIDNLEKNYKISEYTYEFDGQIISRYKVLRKYNALLNSSQFNQNDILIYALTSGTYLNEANFISIAKAVNYDYVKKENKNAVLS